MTTETVRLHEREPQLLARDAAYAAAALADDTVASIRALTERLEQLRDEAPTKVKELRATAPERLKALPEDAQTQLDGQRAKLEERRAKLEAQLKDLRERALDEYIAEFEKQFDAKAAAGTEVVTKLRADERVVKVETAFEPVGDQVRIARTQVKGAVTSVRKTVDVALEAGRAQAQNAKSQVKAAATSTRKTVDTIVDAGRELVA